MVGKSMRDIDNIVADLLKSYSRSELEKSIKKASLAERRRALTVVVNFGMHALPEDVLRGDVFYFSEGNLDLSKDRVHDTIKDLSFRCVRFLRKKVWNEVYLIPSGHPLLVSLCTLILYRVTRIDPTVVYYLDGEYIDAKVDIRAETVSSNRLT